MKNGKTEDKRDKILEATYKLISEKGFHGTAMSKVAKEAGVSAGIIYHYFKNKEELIIELFKSIKRQSVEAVLEGFDQTRPLSSQIHYVCEQSFRYSLQHPKRTIFMEQFITSPYYKSGIDKELNGLYKPITDCVKKAQDELIIKKLPHEVILTLVVDVANMLVQKQSVGLVRLTDELVDMIINSLWEAIRL